MQTSPIAAVPVLLAGLALAVQVRAGDPIVPTDGMDIVEDTTFVPGTYVLPNGVSIGADGVT